MGSSAIILCALLAQPPVITEVAANPLLEISGEFVEIYNPSAEAISLQGFSITDGDALDPLLPWDEQVHGTFPHPGMVLGTDTVPPGGFALVFELDYPDSPCYDIPPGTVILTTGDHAICNGLAASSDPLTLFDSGGTADSNAVSTYGTPLPSDIWQERDDDGLDGIPFDPGEFHSVERKSHELPDEEYCWSVSPEGGTPGGPAVFVDTLDASVDSIIIIPALPQPGQPLQLASVVSNQGTATALGVEVTIFIDSNADSLPQPGETVLVTVVDSIVPGQADTVWVTVDGPEEGYYLAAAGVCLDGDAVPDNNVLLRSFRTGDGVPLAITEVLCNPSSEDTDEFIEVYYPGPGVFDVIGCSFTDGDALDVIVPWDSQYGHISDPDALASRYLTAESYGVILDREYTQGTQPYDLPEGTVVLTTGNTTLGDGLSGSDPVTLYSHEGTSSADVMSTYGTPVQSDDPLLCDDDGLDGIPYDPGEDNSVHRREFLAPDLQDNWFDSEQGPTPGGPPPFFVDGQNAAGLFMECSPPMGSGEGPVTLLALFTNTGTDTIPSGTMEVGFYADLDESGSPCQGELVHSFTCGTLAPGDTLTADCQWNSCQGEVLHFAISFCPGDSCPQDDTLSCRWNYPGPVAVNEIMYAPSPGDPEWIEVINRSSGAVCLEGWTFEDSKDRVVFCTDSLFIQPDSFAVVTSDSSAFMEVWPGVRCPVLQPPSWPVLNNSTQQGEAWADIVIVRDGSLAAMDYVPYDDDWGGGSGASLEKISPDLPGWDPAGWSGCSSGGTPGEANSCSGQGGQDPGRFLHYHPDPFSPDGDGRDDLLTVEMNFGHPENEVTLEIYNIQGRLVLRLLDRENCGPSRTIAWDGSGEDGSRLPVGRYIILLRSRAGATGEYREDCGVVVLARPL